tara:strand:- start:916 stop:1152 length:237 start_codon:yes stop_codon:yes gene_type:complete
MTDKKQKKNKWLVTQLVTEAKPTETYINSISVDKNIIISTTKNIDEARVWTSKELDQLYKTYPLGQEGFHSSFTLLAK